MLAFSKNGSLGNAQASKFIGCSDTVLFHDTEKLLEGTLMETKTEDIINVLRLSKYDNLL